MAVAHLGYDNVHILQAGTFTVVTGVEVVQAQGVSDDWQRDNHQFLVPKMIVEIPLFLHLSLPSSLLLSSRLLSLVVALILRDGVSTMHS